MGRYHTICLGLCLFLTTSFGLDPRLDAIAQECFKRSYPQIQSIEDNVVLLRNGKSFVWDDGLEKSYDEALLNPDLNDAFASPYPLQGNVLERNLDTSRIRPIAFYKAIYGESEEEARGHIIKVPWFFEQLGESYIYVSSQNGASEAFIRAINRLQDLPQGHYQFLSNQDAFFWRTIADSPNLSPHSFGIALDINTKFSKYWLWDKKEKNQYFYENQIPIEIIHAFEEEGFVWGGRWWHYDTMHFEYRPEILCYTKALKNQE